MITCYFGLPGCGKSTMLAKLATKELKKIRKGKSKYKRVLSNYYIQGTKRFDFSMIGHCDMSESLILIDEISLDADSRDFKQFNHDLKQFFILHRHYGCDIIYATQQYDGVDRKIRELTHDLWYMKKAGALTYAVAIYRHITITEESDIKMGYIFPKLLQYIFNARANVRLCWRPRFYKYFDSFDAPVMKQIEFPIWGQENELHFRVQSYLLKKLIKNKFASAGSRAARLPKALISKLKRKKKQKRGEIM